MNSVVIVPDSPVTVLKPPADGVLSGFEEIGGRLRAVPRKESLQ